MPITGGCACGRLRYAITSEPVFQNLCACSDCRARSGAGHAAWATFADRASVTLTGEAREWSQADDRGGLKTNGFCPACGSPVYLTFPARPELFTVAAGSLDAPEAFTPQLMTYAARALAWDAIDPALPRVQKMPG